MRNLILVILMHVSASVATCAQERLSELPWEKRDSIISSVALNYFQTDRERKDVSYDGCAVLIMQQDNDHNNFDWTRDFRFRRSTSILRIYIPSYEYYYRVELYGDVVGMHGDIEKREFAGAHVTEDLEINYSYTTNDVTLYSYNFNDTVLRKHLKPTRYPKCYEAPTKKELKSDKYMYGKSIASLDKETRINILTAIAQAAVKEKYPQLYRDTVYPVIAEGTFKFLKYKWQSRDIDQFVNRGNVPRGAKPNDIYHRVVLYYEYAKQEGFGEPYTAKVYIADKTRKPFLIEVGKNENCELMTATSK